MDGDLPKGFGFDGLERSNDSLGPRLATLKPYVLVFVDSERSSEDAPDVTTSTSDVRG